MNYYEYSTHINASAETIWAILTNRQKIVSHDLGVTKIEGDIQPGKKINLWAEVSGDRKFTIKVIKMNAPNEMVWQSGMPFGLFTGTRVFSLMENDVGTEFKMREDYTGLLSNMIFKSIPNLEPSFEKYVLGVKRLAEGASE